MTQVFSPCADLNLRYTLCKSSDQGDDSASNVIMSNVQASTGGMRSQLGVYRDLRDNLSEGLRFYMSVQEAIATLRQQAGDYILTRRLQR